MNHPGTAPEVAPEIAPEIAMARMRWRAAGESLFPALISDPASYSAAVEAIGAIASGLRGRNAQLADLARAVAAPDQEAADLGVQVPPGVPVPLIVAVACGMRERDLIAEQAHRERTDAVDRARAAGSAWAVLQGPERIEELTLDEPGAPTAARYLHLDTGAELQVGIDGWCAEPFRIEVLPADGATATTVSFAEREPWIQEFLRARAELDGR
jgi:hypothetical protein